MKPWLFGLLIIIFIMALAFFGKQSKDKSTPAASVKPTAKQFSRAETVMETGKTYTVTLQTTAGDIAIELDSKSTPVTANNFVFLAQQGFYDKTIFHRVIKGFMVQGGDPKGDGTGGPGYQFPDEPIAADYRRGTVAMANSGPNTNGSQFFIMHADYALPKNYVIFGRVVSGLDAVDKIAAAPVKPSRSGEISQPVDPVALNSVSIQAK